MIVSFDFDGTPSRPDELEAINVSTKCKGIDVNECSFGKAIVFSFESELFES
jgi:hypothetical protein